MHGQQGEDNRNPSRRMLSVPSRGLTSTSTVAVDSIGCSANWSFKDGHRISVGDCALFKPPQDSPPSLGIIHCLTSDKATNLRLTVNWLYRPAEAKFGKGIAFEAVPNEVFYSLQRDEISATLLLHPCKVAFLPKGVELPPGVSSFVCRQVYDIANRCLWWLTDQDYTNEVEQLLHKTVIEMHAAVQQQQGTRSPKPVSGSAATSPLKSSPDSVQNSSSNLSSQTKGKKREREDQSSEHIRREHSVRADDDDSGQLESESMLNLEIAKITEKGGLVDTEAVEKLVHLMQLDSSEGKIDLNGRSMLAGIIAATEKVDCLSQFVQLKGLPVLDEWLQEVHKGKVGDSSNLKDGDKSVEDYLLVLLCALDKLPVNLNALQMCHIGKSVNHLRSYKNSEIQKKARSLVDRWKKRVEAEMNINDRKSGSSQAVPWPGRSRHDGSYGGNKHSSVSSDVATRSSVTHHSSLRSTSVRLVQGDTTKSASACTGITKSALSPTSTTANHKDGQSRISASGGSSERPQAVQREEKSSSSSQSHTNSQCSSDHAKNAVPSGKEDARSSTAGSRSLNKTTASGSKHRKSASSLQGVAASGVPRETTSNRNSSLVRTSVVEKVSHTVNASGASVHEVNNHKFIVKIPNRGRGPAQSSTGASAEDSSCRNTGASSPILSEKHDQSDAFLKVKHDTHLSGEVDGSPTGAPHRSCNDALRPPNISKVAYSPSRSEMKSTKALDSSFSSMNALIESCVKFSEANASKSAGDDVGMNLLASVAARESSKSGIVSPAVSPQRNSSVAENSCSNYSGNQNQLHDDDFIQRQCQSTNVGDADNDIVAGVSEVNDGETSKHCSSSGEDLYQNVEGCLKNNGKLDGLVGAACLPESLPRNAASCADDEGAEDPKAESVAGKDESHDELHVVSQEVGSALATEDTRKGAHLDTALYTLTNGDDQKNNVSQGMLNITFEQNLLVSCQPQFTDTNEKPALGSSATGHVFTVQNSDAVKSENTDGIDVVGHVIQGENRRLDQENNHSRKPQEQEEAGLSSADMDSGKVETVENEGALAHQSGSSVAQISSSAVAPQETKLSLITKGSKLTAVEGERKEESASPTGTTALSPASGASDVDVKLGFDLNEGFDDGKYGEPVKAGTGPSSDTVCLVSSTSGGLPASITVAAAAKGPFVPPDDLLRNKREVGWKGSAATSAFRPAEPRKVMEVPLSPSKAPLSGAPACKQARPLLDIDLNVADERIFLDTGCQTSNLDSYSKNNPGSELMTATSSRGSGGFDLDLNKVDEAPDVGQHSASIFHFQRQEGSTLPGIPTPSNIISNGETYGRRDFDLNRGPSTDEMSVEQTSFSQHAHGHGNIPLQPPFGPRLNNSDTQNFFSWYPPATNYSISVRPSSLPDRGEQAFPIIGIGGGSQHVMGGPTSSMSFSPDTYRASVLSSSPAMPFLSAPFQYPSFPFGTSFPLPTSSLSGGSPAFIDPSAVGRISAIPSQLVGTTPVPFQYPHAYVVSRPMPDIGNSGIIDSNQKWSKQGLDLNSGPGGLDVEGRRDSLPTVSRQLSAISSQSLAEEQVRMYNVASGVLKRKEPEGEWNMDKLKPSSWR